MLIGFLIVAAFLLALALIVARVTGGYVGTSIVMGILGAIVTFLTLMPFVFLSALGIVAVGMRCHARDLSYRRYLIETCSVTFFFTLLACLYAGSKVKKQTDMAAQYPFESISDRLAYEKENKPSKAFPQPHLDFTDKTSQVTDNRSHESASNLTDIESQIENIESSWQARRRVRSLKAFHANYVTQFVNAPGFGIGRGSAMRPSVDYVPLEDPAPIPVPSSEYDYSDKPASESASTEGNNETAEETGPASRKLFELHTQGLFDFINPKGFGYIESRDRVAGFQSHRFSTLPKVEAASKWVIQDLELVSLLKHKEPVAYLSKNLPRMDELRNAPTRSLDSFEIESLKALQAGEDLQVQHGKKEIRMLGSIRAAKQCLQCHEVERGDLLGAFSYKLKPE